MSSKRGKGEISKETNSKSSKKTSKEEDQDNFIGKAYGLVQKLIYGMIFLALIGFLANKIVLLLEKNTLVPVGDMVTIEDHKVNIWCSSSVKSDSTVLLIPDAGRGDSFMNYFELLTLISSTSRVCSYDRFSRGFTEYPSKPVNASLVVEELEGVVSHISQSSQVTLVCHSLSCGLASLYASLFPSQVKGLILLNPLGPSWVPPVGELNSQEILTICGVTRLGSLFQWMELGFPFPEAVQPQLLFHFNQQQVYSAARREWEEFLPQWNKELTLTSFPVGTFPVRAVVPLGSSWDTTNEMAQLSKNVESVTFPENSTNFPQRKPKETFEIVKKFL